MLERVREQRRQLILELAEAIAGDFGGSELTAMGKALGGGSGWHLVAAQAGG